MNDCIFCKIIRKEIPAGIVFEDEEMLIFKDISPKANIHFLAILKEHFAYLDDLDEKKGLALSRMLKKISSLKDTLGFSDGYRLIINQGEKAGQTVFHLHVHILGGQELPFCDLRKE